MSAFKCEKHNVIFNSNELCDKCMAEQIIDKVEFIKQNRLPMGIAIVGGRDFNNYDKLCRVLEPYKKYCTYEVCGEAKGADSLGKKWAKENNIEVKSYPAEWDKHGKAAGHIRNEEMTQESDFIVAFWDGKSRGTKNMIDNCLRLQKNILVVFYD